MMRLAVVGPGRAGLALARRFTARGWPVLAVRGRQPAPAAVRAHLPLAVWDTRDDPLPWPEVDLVLIAVPDRDLGPAAEAIAAAGRCGGAVLHVSGLHPAEAAGACRRCGAAVASWHPLLSFPPVDAEPPALDGVYCAIEGDEAAVHTGFAAAELLGMRPWRIAREDKELYHAAAAVAGNLVHLLLVAARAELGRCGMDPDESAEALRPLVESTVQAALRAQGLELLSGPLARGDDATVARHLAVLPSPLAAAYRALACLVTRA